MNPVLEKAKERCYNSPKNQITGKYCKRLFDGYMCWEATPAGVLANQSCANDYLIPTGGGFATKQCNSDGEWFTPADFTDHWTNYSQCGLFTVVLQRPENHTLYKKWLPILLNVRQTGYILSTISLITALFVFIYIKRLHCARNKLHIHLFVSFVMRALMALIKDCLFVRGTALAHEVTYNLNGEPVFDEKTNYSWICKAIVSVGNYFIISNYMFLLMEGAYLHNLLFLKLFSENGVAIYYCLGWGFPIIFIIPWIILRALSENTYCWTMQSNKYIAMLIDIPIGLSVIINFVLFVIIIRILFIKLTSMYLQQRWTKYQKLVRAILILVPIFGIPYTVSFVLYFHVEQNPTLEILWLFFDQTFTAFQGLFASSVYCLMNNEVQVEIARKYHFFKERNKEFKRRSRTISHTTQVPLTEELAEIPQHSGPKEELFGNKTSDYF